MSLHRKSPTHASSITASEKDVTSDTLVIRALHIAFSVVILVALCLCSADVAHAQLLTQAPNNATVLDFNQITQPVFTVGPKQIGAPVGESIIFTATAPNAVVNYNGTYGLCNNGTWTGGGRGGYSGVSTSNDSMTFKFSRPLKAVGGFVNYARGCGISSAMIQVLDAQGNVLEQYVLNSQAPINTPGQLNAGAFRGISRAAGDIYALRLSNQFVVLDDLTFVSADTLPPTVTADLFGAEGANGWYTSAVQVSLSASDNADGSGVNEITYAVDGGGAQVYTAPFIITDDGVHTVTFQATDNDGNAAAEQSLEVKIDTTAPLNTASAATLPDNSPYSVAWTNKSVKVSFNCTDNTSGVFSQPADAQIAADGANQSSSGTCTDNAGNEAPATFSPINIDKTAPHITVPANIVETAVSSSGNVVNYGAVAANDNLDAAVTLASCSPVSGSTFLGVTTVQCSATDHASNQATGSFTVSVLYNFLGFFQPVDNPPFVNMANAGSAIPVKFSLSGNKGLNIFAAGYPVSQQIACVSGAPLAVIEQTITAGGSSLSYDPTFDQYVYVWKTDKSWKGTCRQLILNLNDGTTHAANFQFK